VADNITATAETVLLTLLNHQNWHTQAEIVNMTNTRAAMVGPALAHLCEVGTAERRKVDGGPTQFRFKAPTASWSDDS